MNRLRKLAGALTKAKTPVTTTPAKVIDVPKVEEKPPAPPKKEYYVTSGPHLYISKLLNKTGPLTTRRMWYEYTKDVPSVELNIIPSLTFLKKKIVPQMVKLKKIERTSYSEVNRIAYGYKLNPQKAFYNVDPAIVESLVPKVDVKVRKPRSASTTPATQGKENTSPRSKSVIRRARQPRRKESRSKSVSTSETKATVQATA